MKLYNHTPVKVGYDVSFEGGGGDCGSIDPGGTVHSRAWDGKNIRVNFVALPPEPSGVTPFTVTIPETKPGMAVTIGLFHQ